MKIERSLNWSFDCNKNSSITVGDGGQGTRSYRVVPYSRLLKESWEFDFFKIFFSNKKKAAKHKLKETVDNSMMTIDDLIASLHNLEKAERKERARKHSIGKLKK